MRFVSRGPEVDERSESVGEFGSDAVDEGEFREGEYVAGAAAVIAYRSGLVRVKKARTDEGRGGEDVERERTAAKRLEAFEFGFGEFLDGICAGKGEYGPGEVRRWRRAAQRRKQKKRFHSS